MTRGYLSGHLTFKYPQPLSILRERYICSFIERDEVGEILRTKALLNSQFVGLNTKDDVGKKMSEAFQGYAEILLPNKPLPGKIKDMGKDALLNLKKAFEAERAKIKKPPTK